MITSADAIPLSFAQQRLWFLEQLEGPSPAYNVRLAVRLRGILDVAALEDAVARLVERHEALRTRIVTISGEPAQVIDGRGRTRLERIDFQQSSGAELRQRVAELSSSTFDLAAGPLFRCCLLSAAPGDHVLLFVMHHVVSDAWSSGVMFRDLAELYNSRLAGRAAVLPEIDAQYADFAIWQREWLQGETLERQIAFWRKTLAGAPGRLNLPADFPRPKMQTYRGTRWTRVLRRDLTDEANRFARREGCTLFMVLLAVFDILLGRQSGQDDVVVGTPIAARRRTELEPLVGFFANTLALRCDLSGDPDFRGLLMRVRTNALAAYDHQDVPFEKLVEVLQPARTLEHSPIFQVMFILQNSPWEASPLQGLTSEPAEADPPGWSKFDLTLSATEYDGEIWLSFEYNTALFAESSVAAMSASFEALLRGAICAPELSISALAGKAFDDGRTPESILHGPALDIPAGLDVSELIASVLRLTPERLAVEAGGRRITCRELAEQADQLCDRLRVLGASPGTPVGICLERSPELVGAVLGVLGSGMPYLPLDPDFPAARLAFMLADSGCECVLTQRSLLGRFADFSGRLLCIDDRHPADCGAAGGPANRSDPQDTAYLIYTSGSTGVPKGVCVSRRSLLNFLLSVTREPGLQPGDRLLAVTTLSFDIAALELLAPLVAGATVVIAVREEVQDPQRLARLMADSRINVMQATPATWRSLLEAGWSAGPELKILCGGETLSPDLARRLLEGGAELWNMYGPTETTVWSTCARIEDQHAVGIGLPLANTSVYVVDGALNVVPRGVAGELLIGGAGVARGYWGREEETARRFVRVGSGERVYRTGDRVRLRAEGRLEYLGRLDGQLKLRGYRIEPAEIESAVLCEPQVAGCAVAVQERAAGDARLVCYVVGRAGARLDGAQLRAALKARLPDYLVPGVWVQVGALPLTPNGKLDRAGLPAPSWEQGVGSGVLVGARSAVEELLCGLFAELLGVARVGIHTDFFAAGGHSLLAARLAARIRAVLQVELPLKRLFEAPTVAGLAVLLPGLAPASGPELRAGAGPAGHAPLSAMQQRLWFLEQLAPGSSTYHLHVAYRLNGAPERAALQAALDELVARHAVLRTTFVSSDGEPAQRIGAALAIPVQWERAPGGERALTQRLRAHVEQPFELSAGPLLRVVVLGPESDQDDGAHTLLIVLHHLIADGWSMGVLLGELGALYRAARRGTVGGLRGLLPELPIQYADYARWQRAYLSGAELARQLGYWREQLAGAPAELALPHDRARLPVQRHRGAWVVRRLPAVLLGRLHGCAREAQATLHMVLLAAWALVLSRYGGDEQVLIGTPVAGRPRRELEGLIGFFINTLVLRIDTAGAVSFRALLERTRHVALNAYAHPDVPFEKLVDELKPPRHGGRSPFFQVMFNLHNEPVARLDLGDIAASPFAVQRHTSKFDLSLSVFEAADGLSLNCEYDTDLFEEATVAGLLGGYERCLEQVSVEPDRGVWEVELAQPAGESARGRVRGGGEPGEGNLVERFSAQVAAHGERVAVWEPGGAVSYAELAGRAQRIAGALSGVGGAASPVAVLLGHDATMVAGLLGVLGAGRAYVPLDAYAPRARQEAVLREAGVGAVVVDAARLRQAGWLAESGLPVVVADELADARGPAMGWPAVRLSGDTLAYVLFTSGTTGRPKGVPQRHAAVLGHIGTWRARLALGAGDRVGLFASYGYDAAVQDVFGGLFSGATLHPLELRGGGDSNAVVEAIAVQRLTVLHFTPTVYRYLFGGRVNCMQDLSAVRLVVLGGEAARRADLELFKVRFRRGTRLINGYGLTECTMGLQYVADHDTRVLGAELPIGWPVGEVQMRLRGADGRLHPGHGELELASAHLTVGYLNDAPLTAQRFVRDEAEPGRRWYRTGDRLRRLPDGSYVHAGRVDSQLKLRGMRVEPGEVEAALCGCAGVREAVLIGRECAHAGPGGELQLCAYVAGAAELQAGVLRAQLRAVLPESLVPAVITVLPALPRLPNGKLDRAALPETPARVAEQAPAAPGTDIEQRLATIWTGVLGVEPIGRYDDFFALGGHSLLATRLIARVRDAFRVELPLLVLFDTPNIAGMAEALRRYGAEPRTEAAPAITRRTHTPQPVAP